MQWFGRYSLGARLATGGMAEVYVARRLEEDGSFSPLVALKRLLPHLIKDRQVVQMFLNEARITAQIRHPNVISILELGAVGPEPFISMELLEGRSFADVRERAAELGRHVPLGITLRVLVDACRGLDAAHRAVDEEGRFLRIVHRDFTPENIHVGVDGGVKVIDFGIAKAEALGSGTEPGTLKGKFFYMSPEMISGQPVDHRADLFAAGVMLYEQLCGRRPFTGPSAEAVLFRISEGRPRRPTEFDPSVPPALEEICLTALAREPEQRFASLQDFITAIESVGGAAEVAAPQVVAAYMESLFPRAEDPRRQLLDSARGAFGLASAQPVQARGPAPSGRTPAQRTPSTLVPPPAAAVPAAAGPKRSRVLALLGVMGVLMLLGAGAVVVVRRTQRTPAERLAAAEATQQAQARAQALAGLGKDERATAADLARAEELLLAAGAWAEALELAEAHVRRFPQEVQAHLAVARASTELGQGRRADQAIEQATALAPGDVRPALALVALRERQGDMPGALGALERAYARHPEEPQVAPRYGLLLSSANQLERAAEVLGAWTRKHEDARALAELGYVRYRQENMAEAQALLRRALRKQPDLAVAHTYLGALLFRKGDIQGAERAYLEADRLAPQEPQALAALCQLQAHQGRQQELEATRRALRQRFPDKAQALEAQCNPSP